jgi:hypothetical protein
MLGSGKNKNLQVSEIKDKFSMIPIAKDIGEGLGGVSQQVQVDLLFTDQK